MLIFKVSSPKLEASPACMNLVVKCSHKGIVCNLQVVDTVQFKGFHYSVGFHQLLGSEMKEVFRLEEPINEFTHSKTRLLILAFAKCGIKPRFWHSNFGEAEPNAIRWAGLFWFQEYIARKLYLQTPGRNIMWPGSAHS